MNAKDKVEQYLNKYPEWISALEKLRKILLDTGLEEDYKWSLPVYTFQGKNIAGMGATKEYIGVWFFQGGLLADNEKVLVNAQEGKTKAMRQWRFKSEKDINKKILIEYLKESIKNHKEGKIIKATRNKELAIPAFLQEAIRSDKELQNAFEKLTLGKKRDFAEYIETAKQESTKITRLEKIIPMIKAGVGLNDKYKSG